MGVGGTRLLAACAGAVATGGTGRRGPNPGGNKGPDDADGPTIARPNVRALATTASLLVMRTLEALGATIEVRPEAREKTLAQG